tara:strand:+ start:134 stop:724 length:591 start_codon:yes stop_codon:yes gene_type:complete
MRYLLILCLFIPLNLLGESVTERYGNWYEITVIDDFTDEKKITVSSYDEEIENAFYVIRRGDQNFDFLVSVKPIEECAIYHDNNVFMLFRVDKNKLLELPMIKYDEENSHIYGVNFEILLNQRNEKKSEDFIIYLEEMKKGKTLKIRINDKNNGCKKDLTFDLNEFDKAINQLSDDIAKFTNFIIIQNELDKIEAN